VIRLTLGVPLMVLDDNRGLVDTTLREDGSVNFKRDVEFVVYPFVPENLGLGLEVMGTIAVFPVIICKQSALSKATTVLENGTRQMLFNASSEFKIESVLSRVLRTEIARREDRAKQHMI
jgi:hypothetical protein